MTAAHSEAPRETVRPAFYSAREAATILAIPLPSLYELARTDPERFGVIRLGRSLRLRRKAIDRIVEGDTSE